MSLETRPKTPRARDPTIDLIKLQLLNIVNQLRSEIIEYKFEQKKVSWDPLSFTEIFFQRSKKDLDEETKLFVASINDRLYYLLDIAKNLLRDENDPDNTEYNKFAELATSIVKRTLKKKKFLGLIVKDL